MRLTTCAAGAIIVFTLTTDIAEAQQAPAANQGAIAAPAYRAEASMQDDFLRQETVTTRAHPETDAQGVTADSWIILPRVGVEEKFNDNIYATNSGTLTDFITTVAPDILVRSNWNNGLVTFDANSSSGIYASHTTENFNDYSFAGTGRLDITRQDYLAVRGGYYYMHEERTSPNNNFGIEPTTYGLTDAEIEGYSKLNRVSFTADGILNKYEYNNVGTPSGAFIPNKDRSRNEYSGSLRVGYEIQPLLEAFVKGVGSDRSYDHKTAVDGFQRSSIGYAVTAGVALDLGGITFGELGVGYMSRSYDDIRFGTVHGVTANAALTWNVTPITTVRLNGQRTIEETINFGSPGFISSLGTLSIDHELLRNLLLNANGGINYNDYQLIPRRDTIAFGGVGATYLMNRNMNLSVKYSYRNQDSNVTVPTPLSYSQNLALVRLTLQM